MAAGRYSGVVAANVLRRIEELDLTRLEVSLRSGVSLSFLSELTAGRANPSLRVLASLADALETEVPLLLTDLEGVPPGYEHVSVVLPKDEAAGVRRQAADAERRLRKLRS